MLDHDTDDTPPRRNNEAPLQFAAAIEYLLLALALAYAAIWVCETMFLPK